MKTDNELIAEFMGFTLIEENPVYKGIVMHHRLWKLLDAKGNPVHPYYGPIMVDTTNPKTTGQFQFHCSWDWLMPVVEKIHIESNSHTKKKATYKAIIATLAYSVQIDQVYKAVVEFIKWYNQQKP